MSCSSGQLRQAPVRAHAGYRRPHALQTGARSTCRTDLKYAAGRVQFVRTAAAVGRCRRATNHHGVKLCAIRAGRVGVERERGSRESSAASEAKTARSSSNCRTMSDMAPPL